MIEWIMAIATSIAGAGAGTAFDKLFNKPTPTKTPPPSSSAETARRFAEIREWQGKVERMLLLQDRQIRKMKRQLSMTRLLLDAVLVTLLIALVAWFFWGNS